VNSNIIKLVYKLKIFLLCLLILNIQIVTATEDDHKRVRVDNGMTQSSVVTPTISQPLDKSELATAIESVASTNNDGKKQFFSFVSEYPTSEEMEKVAISESEAVKQGYEVARITVPQTNEEAAGSFTKNKSYVGTVEVDIKKDKKAMTIAEGAPTPVERTLALMFPLKSAIVNPIAWSAHTGPAGVMAVTFLSVVYGYFVSTYWHMFRVFFNNSKLINSTRVGEVLDKVDLLKIAEKFGISIPENKFRSILESFNAKKVAMFAQYSIKKFAFDVFNGELYKIASMQGGFFTADFHWHILTSKLYSLSYYPVTWIEDKLILNKLVHRDSIAKFLVLKSYIGGALSMWDLSGGMVPFLDVRPGVLLMAFNGSLILGYLAYRFTALKRLGIKNKSDLKKHMDKLNGIDKILYDKLAELKNRPKWEHDLLYFMGRHAKTEAKLEIVFREYKKVVLRVRFYLDVVEKNTTRLRRAYWVKKLTAVKSEQQLDSLVWKLKSKISNIQEPMFEEVRSVGITPGCLAWLRVAL
jgi:hypothetical protein